MKIFNTVQEIETIDLSALPRREILDLRDNLRDAFYHTSLKEKLSDGRSAKDEIGKQLSRVVDFLLSEVTF